MKVWRTMILVNMASFMMVISRPWSLLGAATVEIDKIMVTFQSITRSQAPATMA